MIVKMNVTHQCFLDDLPEVKRVFSVYRAPDNEVTFCCSATKTIFCEEIEVQIEYEPDTSPERIEEIEDIFMQSPLEGTYYEASVIDKLPRKERGSFPEEHEIGCVIETAHLGYESAEEEIEDALGNSF